MTNLEFLNFWISSVFSHVSPNEQTDGEDDLLSPPIFIVGTHLDEIKGTDEEKKQKLDEISTTIMEYLEDKAYIKHVVPEIYFVDNSLRPIGENMKKFKDHVEKVMQKQPYMDKSIPISWFKFQCHVMELRSQKLNYITLEQAKKYALELGIQDEEELFTMLQLFHDVGIIAFYGNRNGNKKALGDLVVLDPQWLLKVFTKVITITKREEKKASYKKFWRILEKKGILEEALIHHVWKEFTTDQRESLLQIMERFDLLCENTVERDECDSFSTVDSQFPRQFFVPCQLTPNDEDDGRIWEDNLNAVVINIVPNDGFLPEGLFHRLSVRAASWTQRREGCRSRTPRLYYRQTELYLDQDHELIMKMHVTNTGTRMIQIIIYYPPVEGDDSKSPTPSMCKEVLEFIENSLQDLKTMWMKNIKLRVVIPCYTCRKYDEHHHDLYYCLENVKVECGRSRNYTKFWKYHFGDGQEEACHPLKNLLSQANGISPVPANPHHTITPSSEFVDDAELQPSTSGLIVELASEDFDPPVNSRITSPGNHSEGTRSPGISSEGTSPGNHSEDTKSPANHSEGTTVNVTGNDNTVIVGSQVNINNNINLDLKCIFHYAILMAICAIFIKVVKVTMI